MTLYESDDQPGSLDWPPEAASLPAFTRHTLQHGELVTLAEAADRLDRPTSTLRRWLSEERFVTHGTLGRESLVGWGDVVEAEYAARVAQGPRLRGLTG